MNWNQSVVIVPTNMSDENFLIFYLLVLFGGKFSGANEKNNANCQYDYNDNTFYCTDVTENFPKLQNNADAEGYEIQCNNCTISSLTKETFVSNTQCGSLHLTNSGIKSVLSGAFSKLNKVQYVHLEKNKITNISEGAFEGMPQGEQVHLEYNELRELVPGMLNGLDCINVYFSNNKISKIMPFAFKGVTSLLSLELNGNLISELFYDSFYGLKSLENLELQYNLICSLPIGVFRHLTKLISLNLSHNKFKELHPSHFSGLISLKTLALANNSLQNFDENILLSSNELSELDISGNGIFILHPDKIYERCPTLKYLYIDDNIFSCSLLSKILIYFKQKGVKVEYFPGIFDVQNINGIACVQEEISESIQYKFFMQKARVEGEILSQCYL